MTTSVRPVAALAAVFAPERAGALLARMAEPDAADSLRGAAADAPRRDRLRTLAGALASDPAECRARAEAAARTERPRVAALIRSFAAAGAGDGASPALVRLCREAIGR
jgi:hypothetical protein